jgi:REP element-mobilizing transposase RayT
MRDFHIPLLPGGLYHVLNRANGNEPLFKTEANYHFFLAKYNQHISPVAQTLAWCLLPNHYHFLIRVKPSGAIRDVYHAKKEKDLESDNLLPSFIMQQFSNWQNSYAKLLIKFINAREVYSWIICGE